MEKEQNEMLADVCRGLSKVCNIWAKEKKKEEKEKFKIKKKKLKIVKKLKMKEIIEVVESSKELEKFANDFEKKARAFEAFAMIYDKEVKNG